MAKAAVLVMPFVAPLAGCSCRADGVAALDGQFNAGSDDHLWPIAAGRGFGTQSKCGELSRSSPSTYTVLKRGAGVGYLGGTVSCAVPCASIDGCFRPTAVVRSTRKRPCFGEKADAEIRNSWGWPA